MLKLIQFILVSIWSYFSIKLSYSHKTKQRRCRTKWYVTIKYLLLRNR